MDTIMYLESQKSPVKSLCKHCSETCSIEELHNKLHGIGRVDARHKVYCAVIEPIFYHSFYFVSVNKI